MDTSPTTTPASRPCPTAAEWELLIGGTATREDADAWERHLGQCSSCQAWFQRQWAEDDQWSRWEALLSPAHNTVPLLGDTTARLIGQDQPQDDTTTYPVIPGFSVERELGRGGMGVVYLARDLDLDRHVALKVLHSATLAGPERLKRFEQEALVVARLDHPHIVRIHSIGKSAGSPYVCLQYVAGATLAEYLETRTPSPPQAAQLMEHLANAVQYAHEQGVIHRDLKPSNILLAPPNSADQSLISAPKITDFGLAKLMDAPEITASEQLLGTPNYLAPETLHGSHEATLQSDVYGLGAILYELLTGRPPFRGSTTWETLSKLAAHDPLPPRQLEGSVPLDLETVCLKAIQRDPSKRYRTAGEFAADLERFRTHRPVLARRASPPERLFKWARRHPTIALAGVLCTTCLFVVLLLWARFTHQLSISRGVAQVQAELAEERLTQARTAVAHYLEQVRSDQRLGAHGLEGLRRSLIEEALQVYAELMSPTADAQLVLEYARARFQLGTILAADADHDERARKAAREQFEQSVALLMPRILAETAPKTFYQTVASTHLSLAKLAESAEDHDQATAHLESAAQLYASLSQRGENGEMLRWQRAILARQRGRLAALQGDFHTAERAYREAVAHAEALPAISDFALEHARAYGSLAQALDAQSQTPEALDAARRSYALSRSVVQTARPVLARYREHLTQSSTQLAQLVRRHEDAASAIALYQEAINQQDRLRRDFPQQASRFLTHRDRLLDEAASLLREQGSASDDALALGREPSAARPDELRQVDVHLNEGYRRLQVTLEYRRAKQAFATALKALNELALRGVDLDEADEFRCLAHEHSAVACMRLGEFEAAKIHAHQAFTFANPAYAQAARLQLTLADAASHCGSHAEAVAALHAARPLPQEYGATRAKIHVRCAASLAGQREQDTAAIESHLRRAEEEITQLEALPVASSSHALWLRAAYHAAWVELHAPLATHLQDTAGALLAKHRDAAWELIETRLQSAPQSRELRQGIANSAEFQSLRGEKWDEVFSH